MNLYDIVLIVSSVLMILLSLAHEFAGNSAYREGGDLGVFKRNADWIPTTGKERTLLGVFFMISFSWWQDQVIIIILLLIGNPLSFYLGILILVFSIPQLLLLRIYVRWNLVAQGIFGLHIIATLFWMIQYL